MPEIEMSPTEEIGYEVWLHGPSSRVSYYCQRCFEEVEATLPVRTLRGPIRVRADAVCRGCGKLLGRPRRRRRWFGRQG